MRKGIVLLSLGWGVLWILFLNQFMLERKNNDIAWEQTTTSKDIGAVSFPYEISDTKLLIKGMGIYEGPYLEDGSNNPVTDVAALWITNCSQHPIQQGAVVLEIDQEQYVFEIFAVPPGECVFVCESERKQFTNMTITACSGWAVEDTWPAIQGLFTISEIGMDTLEIKNLTDQMVPHIQLLYKSYDQESNVYIGGICHTLEVLSLRPGESRTVTPYRYVRGYSRVVAAKFPQ